MSKKISILFMGLFFSVICMGQKTSIKFGKIDPENLKMKSYKADSSAGAVVLMDKGRSTVLYDQNNGAFFLMFERHTRIKILTKEGYDWANVEIPLYHDASDRENVLSLKGMTHNLEKGKINSSKLSKKGVFTEKSTKNWDYRKFTLPNVKVGINN